MESPVPGRVLRLVLAFGVLVLPAAKCSDGSTEPPVEDDVPARVVVSPAADTLNWLGATRQLSAQVLNGSGGTLSVTVSWSSQATGVATVSSAGVVTAVGAGTATIVAQAGSASGSGTVAVRQVPASVTKRAGDGQTGAAGGQLATTLEVEVKDQGGALVASAPLTWTVTAGGGTLSSASTTTDAAGVGRATWRLGSTAGPQTVQVASGPAQAVTFSATATATSTVSIAAVTPSVLREGSSATATGTGFSSTASQNQLTLDGLAATITAASATSLTFTVPASDCRPAHQGELRVQVGSASGTRSVSVAPDTVIALVATNGWYSTTNCIHLAAGSASERYVVGVLSLSETPSSLTPLKLSAAAAASALAVTPLVPSPGMARSFSAPPLVRTTSPTTTARPAPALSAARRAHDAAEARLRAEDRRLIRRLGSAAASDALRARAAAGPAAVPAVGDTLTFTVPGSCSEGTQVKGVVKYVGSGGLWVEDTGNPVAAFTTSEYKDLDDFYSSKTHKVLTTYYGGFVDVDGNQRTLILLTKEVNKKENLMGFVWGGDLYPKSMCAKSNQGEIFYGVVPDPNGTVGQKRTKSDVAAAYPTLVAHEITHVLQMTQMIYGSAGDKASWEMEGGATLAEQLVGYSVLGHASGQDLGATVYWNAYDSGWYKDWAIDLATYFGFAGDTRVAAAPEQCSWMGDEDEGNTGPCDNLRAVYGVPATFLRFVLDRYGPAKTGGESALLKELTASSRSGLANLAAATGDSSTRLLVLFGITLWADGRIWNSLTSWNLYEVFQSFKATARLQPYASSAAEPTLSVSVRAGSNAYLEWSPASHHAATSFKARTTSGGTLPSHMVLWVLRVQ